MLAPPCDMDALRYNQGKPRFDLIPSDPLEDIARVLTMGADKYEKDNWRKGMPWSQCTASLMRHMNAFNRGEDLDTESGLPHMAHVAVNAMFILEFMRTHREKDDRWKPPSPTADA